MTRQEENESGDENCEEWQPRHKMDKVKIEWWPPQNIRKRL